MVSLRNEESKEMAMATAAAVELPRKPIGPTVHDSRCRLSYATAIEFGGQSPTACAHCLCERKGELIS